MYGRNNSKPVFLISCLTLLVAGVLHAGCASFEPLPMKDCRTVSGVIGPEDFVLDKTGSSTRLIVSSQARRDGAAFKVPGGMFSIPVTADGLGAPSALPLANRDKAPFHPHGIAMAGNGENKRLYVINHAASNDHSIEIFRVEPGRLVFEKRLRDDLLVSPNDLAALPDGQLYVSNDHGYRGFLGFIEDLTGAGWANVVHYRAGKWTRVAEGISFANGVEVNKQGDRLYVAGTRDDGIHVFPRDPATGAISKRIAFWDVPSGVDNLMWENETTLNVAAHPSLFAFLRHAGNKDKRSPSEVFRVDVKTGKAQRIFGDDGRVMDASATALVHAGRMIITGVFDPELVSCRAR